MVKLSASIVAALLCMVVSLNAQSSERYASEIFSDYQLQSNILYGQAVNLSGSTKDLYLDLYTGKGDHVSSRPLVIFIHGGGFKGGDKVSNFGTLVCGGLAKRGYVVASINYRTVSTIDTDQQHFEAMLRAMQDGKAAVRFFRKNATLYGVDPAQVYVTGSSAGSITGLHMAFLDSTEVPSYVDWATVGGTFEGTSGNPGYSSTIQGVIGNWGAIGDTTWMNTGDVPVYLVHGTADVTVYYDQIPADGPFLFGSKFIFDRAQNVGLNSGLLPFEGIGHTLDNNATLQDSAYRNFSAWLYPLINYTIGSPHKLAYGTQPSSTMAGSIISPAITVQIEDSVGNVLTSETSSITIAIGTNGGPGGVLSGTATVAAVNGIATFNDMSIDKAGAGYTLRAMSGTLTEATSNTFTIISSGIAGTIVSTGSGNWSSTIPDAPWPSGIVPGISDAVVIADGSTITIDTDANCAMLTVGQGSSGVLEFEAMTPRILAVTNDVLIKNGAILQSNPSGTVTTHTFSVGGNLINNGTLDFSTNSNTAGAGIIFTGALNATFGGNGAVTNIQGITLNKGASNATILDLNPSSFTVKSVTTDVAGFLTLLNGTFKISGTFGDTNRVFSIAAYSIPATAGFWLNNPNFVVAGQAGNTICDGLLRVSTGVMNIGAASSNEMKPTTGISGATFIFEGGVTNIAGKLRAGSSSVVNVTVSGGVLNVTTIGNSSDTPGFGFTSTSNTISITGGIINLVQRNKYSATTSRRDYNVLGANVTVTGGTLNVGTAATATGFDFVIAGNMPNVVIDNTGTAKIAKLSGAASVYGDVLLNTETTLDVNGKDGFSIIGNSGNVGNLLNNGSIIGITGSRVKFAGTNGQQNYSGSGVFGNSTTPFEGVTFNNSDGVSLNSPIILNRANLFQGKIINSNQMTIGNGGSSALMLQIGYSSTMSAGQFDVAPNFSIGSGSFSILYAGASSFTTAGYEIPPSRLVDTLTVANSNGVILAGGNLTLNRLMLLNSGKFNTGNDTLIIAPVATVIDTGSYIVGNLRKYFSVPDSLYRFEIGDTNSRAPISLKFRSIDDAGYVTASTKSGTHPEFGNSGISTTKKLNRYYSLTNNGLLFDTCDVSFGFSASDLDAGVDTSKIIGNKYDSGIWSEVSVDSQRSTSVRASGITSFGDFILGERASYLISASAGPNGTIDPAGSIAVIKGASQQFLFTPNADYKLDSLFVDGVFIPDSLTSYTFTNVNSAHSIYVKFIALHIVRDNIMIVNPGWNMIAIPYTIPDYRKTVLFPTSISDAFVYEDGHYASKDSIFNMLGCWLKFAARETITVRGQDHLVDSVNVVPGWNMIGTISDTLLINQIVESTPGLVQSSYFGFESAYTPVDTLIPGKAYWVKASSAGKLYMDASAILRKADISSIDRLKQFNTITISDKSGKKQVLYFGSSEEVDPLMYELPPQAPENSFNVRFTSNRYVELVPAQSKTVLEFPIVAEALEYPLTIAWHVNDECMYSLRDASGIRYYMENEGSVTVDKAGSHFTLEVNSLISMPTEFSLTKNYPNPFNPTTTIVFNLPEKATVSLRVANVLGQIVSTLLDRAELNGGIQKVQFNAEGLPSGIYFYTLVAELMNPMDASSKKLQTVKKMLLVK